MGKFLWVIGLLLFVIACSVQDGSDATVGEELLQSDIKIYEIDTFSVEFSTFKFDSIITSDADRILVGQYMDPVFGNVRAASYFELISFEEPDIDNEAVFDSIGLVLHYDKYFYNDTTQVTNLYVHKVLEHIRKREDGYFYNTSTFEYDPTPLTVKAFYPEPFDEDSLYVAMPYEFGADLFQKIREGAISSNAELTSYLKGISLQPGPSDNAAITGFSVNEEKTYLRFFYSVPSEEGVEGYTYDLAINNTSSEALYFNNITSDLNGTGLESLLEDQELSLPSTETANRTFIQSGIGIITKVSFPTIKNIKRLAGDGTLMGCKLILYAEKNSYSGNLSISDTIGLSIIDQNNIIEKKLSNDNGIVYGYLENADSEFNEDYYEFPLETYLQQKLEEEYTIENALILVPNGYTFSVGRIILNDNVKEGNTQAKLIVKYAVYE